MEVIAKKFIDRNPSVIDLDAFGPCAHFDQLGAQVLDFLCCFAQLRFAFLAARDVLDLGDKKSRFALSSRTKETLNITQTMEPFLWK